MERGFRALAAGLLLLLAGGAAGEGLTPERYVTIEVLVRDMTVRDMEARLGLLNSGAQAEARAEADRAAGQIGEIYAEFGTTPHDHAGYGAENAAAISAWLAQHPADQRYLEELDTRFQVLSEQFNALMGGN